MSLLSPQSWRTQGKSHISLDQQLVGSLKDRRLPRFGQLKYLSRILSSREYRILQVLGIILVANLLFLGWKAYVGATDLVPRSGGTYTEGLLGSPTYINPLFLHTNDSDRDLVHLIYSGLMTYTPERAIVTDLAEKFDISKDEKVYTFYLRRNVRWHDGTAFNADDVVFTIAKIQDPRTKSPLYASYKDIVVQKIDPYAVRFTLQKPFAPFLDLMTLPLIPAHLWQDSEPEQLVLSPLNLKPVGTGAWKFKSLQKDQDGTIRSYTVVRNDAYYGEKPFIEKMIFKFYPDAESVIQGLKNRHVQGVSFLTRDVRAEVAKDTDLRYYNLVLPQYTALFFNPVRNTDLQSQDVRQALAYAIDKNRIIKEAVGGEALGIDAPLLEGFIGYHKDIQKYQFDLAKAQDMLAGAGWNKDADGKLTQIKKRTKEKRTLSIEIVSGDTPESARAAQLVKEMWEKLGITVTLTLESSATIKGTMIDPRKYDVLLYGALIGSDPDLYPYWHSSQINAPGLNLALFSDKDADKLLEEGRQTADPKARTDYYQRFQDILAKEVPAIFLYTPLYTSIMTSTVHGVMDNKHIVYPADRFSDVGRWFIKTQRKFKKSSSK